MNRLMSGIFGNPAAAAGLCTFAVAFWMVAGNALYGQKSGHPVPLFATRDAMVTRSVPHADNRRAGREDASQVVPVPAMRPEASAGPTADAEVAGNAPAGADSPLRRAQEALAAQGFYSGALDGLYGPRTRDAILRFEQAAGLRQTGEVTPELLRWAEHGNPAPQRTIEPAPRVDTQVQTAVVEEELPEPQAQPLLREESRPPAYQATIDIRDVRDAALIARVQIGLINFGETGIAIDGVIGERTMSAIRNFQSRYGMPVTGMPDEDLLRKMEQIGALKKG